MEISVPIDRKKHPNGDFIFLKSDFRLQPGSDALTIGAFCKLSLSLYKQRLSLYKLQLSLYKLSLDLKFLQTWSAKLALGGRLCC